MTIRPTPRDVLHRAGFSYSDADDALAALDEAGYVVVKRAHIRDVYIQNSFLDGSSPAGRAYVGDPPRRGYARVGVISPWPPEAA